MQYSDITPSLSADEETIDGITYKTTCDSVIGDNVARKALYAESDYTKCWQSENTPLPHYWQIFYSVPIVLKEFLYGSTDDNVSQLIKDYELQCSNDGLTYVRVAAGICANEGVTTSHRHSINTIKLDDPIKTQYVKLVILDTYDRRGYKWAGLWGIKLIGRITSHKLYVSSNVAYGMKEDV